MLLPSSLERIHLRGAFEGNSNVGSFAPHFAFPWISESRLGIIAEGDIFKPHEDQVLNIQTEVLADEDRRPPISATRSANWLYVMNTLSFLILDSVSKTIFLKHFPFRKPHMQL